MSEQSKAAGPATLVVPVLTLPLGVAMAFVPTSSTYGMAALLVYGPLPILTYRHLRGKKGGWSIAGLTVAALPYLALLAWLLGGEISHRPL